MTRVSSRHPARRVNTSHLYKVNGFVHLLASGFAGFWSGFVFQAQLMGELPE
jgi:hypothetical protein